MSKKDSTMGEEKEVSTLSFQDMELDERLLKAIAKLGWSEPTPVQEAAIPLMLQGRDVLIKARTGSGKTGAFAVPSIQKVLLAKKDSKAREQAVRVLILAPFRELCTQIASHVAQLANKCSREVTVLDISPPLELAAQKPLLASCPDIVVSTPTRALLHFRAGNLQLSSLQLLIVDEADLVFSFGHGEDLKSLLGELPRAGRQTALASATLTSDLAELKSLALRRPAVLKLQEPEVAPPSQLIHYHVGAEEEEKAVILLVLLKLGLVRGRTLVFVNTVDRCYKLKLFLEQFALPSCVLNSELPAAARCHAVSQFNQGLFDLMIASDERDLEQPAGEVKPEEGEEEDEDKPKRKVKKGRGNQEPKGRNKRSKDVEAGVSRGIDFQCVSNVINFDFPKDVQPYIHRVGRTARGKNQGTALSLVSVAERPLLEKVDKHLRGPVQDTPAIKPFQFKLEEVEGFRYRAKDAWRAVTRIAVREARLKEIRQEILNCEKLSSFFEQHPRDLASLRHDRALHSVRKQAHLSHVPDYLIPKSLKRLVSGTSRRQRVDNEEPSSGTTQHTAPPGKVGKAEAKFQAKQRNPLLSMEFKGFNKKKKK